MDRALSQVTDPDDATPTRTMNKELFGTFGDAAELSNLRGDCSFDDVLCGDRLTVAVRDSNLGVPGRTATYDTDRGFCVIWGEATAPADGSTNIAEWLFGRYAAVGTAAFGALNGSYLVAIEYDGDPIVATDPLRSWECFYTDAPGVRVFGTDNEVIRRLLPDPTPDSEALVEYLHLGTVLGERTLFEEIHRVPFDGYLRANETGDLERFVYEPTSFDYVGELADRLRRAFDRRAHYPGRKGLLLSGGYDSRILLSQLPTIDHCYTLGCPDSDEVTVARRLADQYGADHTVLEPGGRYLLADSEKIRYGQGIKESLHIHHAGYDDAIDVDTVYHALLCDTLFKGFFLARESVTVLGTKIPRRRLESDPDPVESLLDTLGYCPDVKTPLSDSASAIFDDLDPVDPDALIREHMEAELEKCWSRTDSIHNAMEQLVIRNQPVLPFHVHLADNFLESFVTLDRELIEWHLRTPPEYRNRRTFNRAIHRLDAEISRHRPPDRPHDSHYLNLLERFARRKLPFVRGFDPAWPQNSEIYDAYDVGEKLFPDEDHVKRLPIRQQLRIHDARWWLSGD